MDRYLDISKYLHPVSVSCYLVMLVLKQSAAPVTEFLVTLITRLRVESVNIVIFSNVPTLMETLFKPLLEKTL